ncbi:gas vesicle accessory protein GvpU [Paenibacillus sp. 1P07SE]
MTTAASKDSTLEFFVKATNKHDFSLDITLNVRGAMISGTTISASGYLESLAESFEEGNEVSQKLGEQMRKAGEAAEESDDDELHFIHLKDAQIYLADNKGMPTRGKVLWRGRLTEVDGYFLGKITESRSSSSS